MISSSFLIRTATTVSSCSSTSRMQMMLMKAATSSVGTIPGTLRWKSNNSSSNNNNNNNKKSSTSKRRVPSKGSGYYYNRHSQNGKEMRKFNKVVKQAAAVGKKEPFDIKTAIPKIDKSQIRITDVDADDDDCLLDADDAEDDDLSELGTLMGGALRSLRHKQEQQQQQNETDSSGMDDIENQLRVMDYFVAEDGSTSDLMGSRRAVSSETYSGNKQEANDMLRRIDELVDQERFDYMELPKTDNLTGNNDDKDDTGTAGSAGGAGTINQIPANQLAHGEWGEMLIRTDRVSKMWRGGRVVSFRALVIGGNTRGCGGFGLGKAFEPEDAVAIACRMAKRNIFFLDRYRNRTLSRDLVGRQNSCKVVLRTTTNGLRGNPLCCEILKLMGITNVVAKAHGNRNHYNVVRATYKALLTHESLDEIAMKRGIRLINLQKAKRLGI